MQTSFPGLDEYNDLLGLTIIGFCPLFPKAAASDDAAHVRQLWKSCGLPGSRAGSKTPFPESARAQSGAQAVCTNFRRFGFLVQTPTLHSHLIYCFHRLVLGWLGSAQSPWCARTVRTDTQAETTASTHHELREASLSSPRLNKPELRLPSCGAGKWAQGQGVQGKKDQKSYLGRTIFSWIFPVVL